LQVLYQLDVQPDLTADEALVRFHGNFTDEVAAADVEVRAYLERLVRGVTDNLADIDARIARASRNWRIERMGRVDRNLLRIAIYEMAFCDDVPDKVAINEAIEIAKRFGGHETPAFINGILDRVLGEQ